MIAHSFLISMEHQYITSQLYQQALQSECKQLCCTKTILPTVLLHPNHHHHPQNQIC
jgi:hypothetical protein